MLRIIEALKCSLRPVADAMLMGFVLLSVYAILGVHLFAHKHPHADEYFGTYSLAFIGLLGIATGDSWTFEVRAMNNEDGLDPQVALFFVSYILLIGIVGINVILTVLIEGFMSSVHATVSGWGTLVLDAGEWLIDSGMGANMICHAGRGSARGD